MRESLPIIGEVLTSAPAAAQTFDLQYLVNFKAFYVEAYMLRIADRVDGDWFAVLRASDKLCIGIGWDKEEAMHSAAFTYPRRFDLVSC